VIAPRTTVAVTVALVAAAAATAAAEPRTIAVTPLSTLGAEVSASASKKITAELEGALAGLGNTKVIGAAAVGEAIRKAKQQRLSSCEGDVGCLKDVGSLVGADLVVFGELGGLGDAQIVYLKVIDAKVGRELRGTTLDVGALTPAAARGAAFRLVDPGKYTGTIAVAVDVPGASVYVNGKLIGKSPVKPTAFAVGTHALRVTHPEYRDFVRFVDVDFDQTVEVPAALQQFPVVQTDVEGLIGGPRVQETEPAWYRKWWAVAGFGAAVFTGAFLIARFTGCQGLCPPPEYTRPVGGDEP
jgi:hypothetical protein